MQEDLVANETWSPDWSSDRMPIDNNEEYHSYQVQNRPPQGTSANYPSRYSVPQGSRQFDNSREFVPTWQANRTNSNNQVPHGTNRSNGNFICFGCGEPGHMKRNCPYKSYTGNYYQGSPRGQNSNYPQQGNQSFEQINRVGTVGGGSSLCYLPVKFRGADYEFIIDTGSGTTIVPTSMMNGQRIYSTQEIAINANGTPLILDGEVRMCVRIGKHSVWMRALVSQQVSEPVLGKDFMREYRIILNMGRREATFKGQVIKLNDRPCVVPVCSQKSRSKENKPRLLCHGCGRSGHIKRFCRFLSEKQETLIGISDQYPRPVTPKKVRRSREYRIRKQESSSCRPEQNWMTGNGSSYGSSSSRSSEENVDSVVQCYGCGRFGHSIENCPYGQSKSNEVLSYGEITSVKEFVDEPSLSEMYGSSCSSLSSVGSNFAVGSGEQVVPVVGSEWAYAPMWNCMELARPVNCIIA